MKLLEVLLMLSHESGLEFNRVYNWLTLGRLALIELHLLLLSQKELLLLLFFLRLGVVGSWKCDLAFKNFIYSDTTFTFNFLLGALFVLLAHVHNRGCRRSIELFTVHTLVLLFDLIGHATMFSLPTT